MDERSQFERLMYIHTQLNAAGLEIMKKKNHDYTQGSGDPFKNFRASEVLGVPDFLGILVRMQDKMQRIRTFGERGKLEVDGEGLLDAVVDIRNYAVLVYALMTEGTQSELDDDREEFPY